MPSTVVYNMNRQEVGKIDLAEEVFNAESKEHLIHLALKIQLASRRAGTVKTKTRSEVSGGGKKPFKQKGTGGARQGTVRAPHYPGGGVAFGPRPRVYDLKMNKKARSAALRSLLSYQFRNNKITVFDRLDFDKISTKSFIDFVNKFEIEKSLLITDNLTQNLLLSSRNVPFFKLIKSESLNVHDMLKYKNIMITQEALRSVEGALQK